MGSSSGISGISVGVIGAGLLLLWSGLKGASVSATLQDLIKGQKPAGTNIKPIQSAAIASAADNATATAPFGGLVPGSGKASTILNNAAALQRQCYVFGAGHSGDPCASRCTDCSSYVSCVLSKSTGRRINMATGGLAGIGTGVPYAQRQPGDVIVWNGGTGGGHTGIIATVDGRGGTMWNNPCTGCGGVKVSRYPYGARTAAAAVVRRV
jgi:cell wall-associated NlpC family hydrolase